MAQINLDDYEKNPNDLAALIELAKQCSDQGHHESAIMLANKVLEIDTSSPEIRAQALERLSISGFYSKIQSSKALGKDACETLSLDPTINWNARYIAGQNGTWYSRSATDIMPSTVISHVEFTPPDDYMPMNPSIYRYRDRLMMIQRTVNYIITPAGHYDMRGDTAIRTRNWLLELNDDLTVASAHEILPPKDLPEPLYDMVIGFEDCRLFVWKDQLWCTSTVRELNQPGYCEITLARIDPQEDGSYCYSNWRVIQPQGVDLQHQKNWMPMVIGDDLRFIYSADPVRIIDDQGATVSLNASSIASDSFRGGSQAIRFDDGWLAIIHESHNMPDNRRRYMHRFVKYSADHKLVAYTEAFHIYKLGIEFAAGIAVNPNTGALVVSFGLADKESWLASFSTDEVRQALRLVPSVVPEQAQYIKRMDAIYGWLLPSAAEIISHTMYLQTQRDIDGNAMEIGTFHGRLFVLLALGVNANQKAIGLDVFEDQHLNRDQSGFGFSENVLRNNVITWAPNANTEILKVDSTTLGDEFVEEYGNVRWLSIDGSHTLDATVSDLKLAEKLLVPGGIAAVDDIYRVAWSGVTAGVYEYLANSGKLIPFAVIPNKVLFTTDESWAETYKAELSNAFPHYYAPHGRQYQEFYKDRTVLLLKDPSDP